MPIATLEQELQQHMDLASSHTGVPKHTLKALLEKHNEAFTPNKLTERFEGWRETRTGREWQHGEFRDFNFNGGSKAFVGHTLRAFRGSFSVSYAPGETTPVQTLSSRQIPTMGDLFRIAQEINLPLEYIKRG
jgi:hypothetical protein